MNINKISGINQATELYNRKKIASLQDVKGISKDKIEISDAARALSTMNDDFQVDRQQKVEHIRNQINNGTYKIDADRIAKGILNVIKEQK